MADRSRSAESSSVGARQWPYLRLFTAEFLNEIFDLTDRQRGVLITALALLHQYGEPMPIEDRQLAWRCKSTSRSFGEDMLAILDAGLLERDEEGLLWSQIVAEELLRCAQKSRQASVSAAQRGKKNKQNQRPSSANDVHREGDREGEEDSGDLSDHQKSDRSSDSNERKKAARDGAASRPIEVNQKIPIKGLGDCFVEKIVSIRPLYFLVYAMDSEGEQRAYRVDVQNRFLEITMDEAENLPDLSEEYARGTAA